MSSQEHATIPRCNFYNQRYRESGGVRDDGWRCGQQAGHQYRHALYTADGERVLAYDGPWIELDDPDNTQQEKKMSETHKRALAQFEAAKKALEDMKRLPDKDNFPIGTVLRWKRGTDFTRCAMKVRDIPRNDADNWVMTQRDRPLTYDYVLVHIQGAEDLLVATGWTSAMVQNPPKIELTDKENEPRRFELTDTKTGQIWYRDGDEWVLYEDDPEF